LTKIPKVREITIRAELILPLIQIWPLFTSNNLQIWYWRTQDQLCSLSLFGDWRCP